MVAPGVLIAGQKLDRGVARSRFLLAVRAMPRQQPLSRCIARPGAGRRDHDELHHDDGEVGAVGEWDWFD